MSFPSSQSNGTQTATIGTEHTLQTITAVGTFLLNVDTSNMVNGDILELRAKKKVLTGGTAAVVLLGAFCNVQAHPAKVSIPVVSLYSLAFTLKQTAGTGRNFDWNIEQIA